MGGDNILCVLNAVAATAAVMLAAAPDRDERRMELFSRPSVAFASSASAIGR
jgi:hypothetical protein